MADITHPDTPRNRGHGDAPHMSPASPAEDARSIALNRVSWGAVLAGVVVALVTHLILNMIGIGFGASTIDPTGGGSPDASSFSIGAGIWFAVTGIVAALLGGYTAGRLAGQPKESSAGWHGLTTWALTTLIVFWLLTTAVSGLIGGAFNTVTNALGGMASAVGGAAQTAAGAADEVDDPLATIQSALQSVLGDAAPAPATGATGAAPGAGLDAADATAAREAATAAIRALLSGDPAQAEQAREEAAQALAQARGVPIAEARTQVADLEAQYAERADQLRQQAAETADAAASAVSTAALLGALGLLLGAVAGWFGGRMGTVEPTMTMANWRAASGIGGGDSGATRVVAPDTTRGDVRR